MFLKLISANLRGSISVCSALGASSVYTLPVSQNKLLQLITFRRSTLQYSTGKAASSVPKHPNNFKAENQTDHLSTEEINALNQDPDSFGTLSTFVSPVQKKPISQPESEENTEIPKQQSSSRKSLEEFETLLKNVNKENGVLEAIKIFEDELHKNEGILPPLQIYEWLIDESLIFNYFDKAFDLYDHMVNRRLKVSLPIIEKLTVAYESSGLSFKKVNSLRKIISKYKYKPNATIYNAMIRIYIRNKQWPTGFELAEEMVQHNFNYEFDTINVMLEACKYEQTNGFNRLLELWHEMHRLGYTPNVHTIDALLNAVYRCEITDFDKLLNTIESIKTKWQAVPMESENNENSEVDDPIDDGRPNLLKIPPKIGRLFPLKNAIKPEERLLILGGLTEILRMINLYNISPTLDTVKSLLKVSPDSFTAQQKSLRLLKKYSIIPDVTLFNILLKRICLRQNFTDAKEVIEMMYTFDVEVDLVTYGLFALTCRTATDAKQFFDIVQQKNISLDVDILNAMLKNACAAEDNNFMISILREMQCKRIEPLMESVHLVEQYQQKLFHNLRTQRVHSKQTRNECFKVTRECKQFLKYFQLDKRSENRNPTQIDEENEKKSTLIGTPTKFKPIKARKNNKKPVK